MSSLQVPSSLRELLADVFEVSPEEVTPEPSTATLDTWDSFRPVLAIEGEYGVQFDPQRIPEPTSGSLLQAELEKKGVAL